MIHSHRFNYSGTTAETDTNRSANLSLDPFESQIQDVSALPELQEKDISDLHKRSVSPGSISIGNSEVNLSAFASERDCEEVRGQCITYEINFVNIFKIGSAEPGHLFSI